MPSPRKVQHREWEKSLTFKCLFCGGEKCKRCSLEAALAKKNSPIYGLHADWILPNIMGMMRPSSRIIRECNLFSQFHKLGINAIFNLTIPGEHPYCGDGLVRSGFPYDPEQFMAEKIEFYNFSWEDMTVPTLSFMMDLVKVMVSILNKGDTKIAVHCHAGYGRTGLAIACCIMFLYSLSPEKAIQIVRTGRPGSIQTTKQCEFVTEFHSYMHATNIVFAIPFVHDSFDLFENLNNQLRTVHGLELQNMQNVPKIVGVLCRNIQNIIRDGKEGKLNVECIEEMIRSYICYIGSNDNNKKIKKEKDTVQHLYNLSTTKKSISHNNNCNNHNIIDELKQFNILSEKDLLFYKLELNQGNWRIIEYINETNQINENYKNRNEIQTICNLNIILFLEWIEELKTPLSRQDLADSILNYVEKGNKVNTNDNDTIENSEVILTRWKLFNKQSIVILRTISRLQKCVKLLLSNADIKYHHYIINRTTIALFHLNSIDDLNLIKKYYTFTYLLLTEWNLPKSLPINKKEIERIHKFGMCNEKRSLDLDTIQKEKVSMNNYMNQNMNYKTDAPTLSLPGIEMKSNANYIVDKSNRIEYEQSNRLPKLGS